MIWSAERDFYISPTSFEASCEVMPFYRPTACLTLGQTFCQIANVTELLEERLWGLVPSRDHLEIDVAGREPLTQKPRPIPAQRIFDDT